MAKDISQKEAADGRSDLTAVLADLHWRLTDIKEMLLSRFGDRAIYGCDEWSTPVVNLYGAIAKVEKLQAASRATVPEIFPGTLDALRKLGG